jgi:hypothetical protein
VVVTVLYAYCTSGYGGTRIDGGHNNRLVAVHVVQVQILHVPAAQDNLVLVEGCIRTASPHLKKKKRTASPRPGGSSCLC